MSDRQFPVLMGPANWKRWHTCPKSVPWGLLSEQRAMLNHGLPLETLAERGGLNPVELMAIIRDEPLRYFQEPDTAIGCAVCHLFRVLEEVAK